MKKFTKYWLYLIPVAFLIVFIILAVGSFSGEDIKAKELTHISITATDYDVIKDDDNSIESIIISTKEYKSKFSVDAVDLINADDFIKSIIKNKTKSECFVLKRDTENFNSDEIIPLYSILNNNQSATVLQMKAEKGVGNDFMLIDKTGNTIPEQGSISDNNMDIGSIFVMILPLILAVGSALFIYFKVIKPKSDNN